MPEYNSLIFIKIKPDKHKIMNELNLKVKQDEKVRLLKQVTLRTIPRIGEIIIYDKVSYKIIDIEYHIPIIGNGDETVNVIVQSVY